MSFDGQYDALKAGAGVQRSNVPVQLKERSPIEINWAVVEAQAKRISDVVNMLYQKLHPVLTPNAPPDSGSGKGQIPAVSPMAESFIGVSDNLGSSASALEMLLERIEL